MRGSRVRAWAVIGLAMAGCAMVLAGCTSKGEGVGSQVWRGAGAATWRPMPVAMRVYPATRYATEGDRPVLDARIELFDQMNDSIKGVGRFRFELFAGDDRTAAQLARRLYRWDVDLLSLAQQRQYYDPVTRSYQFRLRIDDLSIARKATLLEVTFLPLEGQRLETKAVIARAGGS